MKGYLLDTNQISSAVRRPSKVFSQIDGVLRLGVRIGTCVPVLCEVEVGAANVTHPVEYRNGLREVMRKIRVWPLTATTAGLYGDIANDLRRRGRALSQVDIMLAALCRELDLTLVTTDKDFKALGWLKTENWT